VAVPTDDRPTVAVPAGDRQRLVRRNTLLLAFSQGLSAMTFPVLLIVGSVAAAEMTGHDSSVGVVNASYFVAAAAGAFAFGRAMDRFGRKPGLVAAYLVLAAAGVVCGLAIAAESFPLLLAGAVLFGVAFGGANLARTAVADMYEPGQRGRAVGTVLAAATIGAVGSPFLVAFLRGWADGEALDPSVLPWVIVPAAAVAALACSLSLRPDPRDLAIAPGPAAPSGPARSPRELLLVPQMRTAVLAAAVGQMAMVAVMGVTPIALHRHETSSTVVSTVISLHIAGMWAFSPLIGAALDRFGRRPGLIAGGAASIAGALLASTDTPGFVAVGLFAIGLGWSATFLGATAVISDLTDPSERGAALGFNDLLVSLCSAVAGLLGGLVFEGAGFRILGFGVATLVLIVVLGAARLREPSPVRVGSG
jgi:MFS family permease